LATRARREARTHEKHSRPYDHLIESTNRTIAIMDEKKHREALSKAEAMEAVQDAETTTPGRTFIREADKGNASSKISR
jgi:hypothetical protein